MEKADWVTEELATLKLKDKRLEKRAEEIVRQMAKNPSGSIPEFSKNKYGAKATYRFLENEKSDVEQLIESQRKATLKRMGGEKRVLCMHDTSDVELSHYPSIKGQGSLPRGRGKRSGFLMHNTMAVSEEGVPLGLLAQQTWTRPVEKETKEANRLRPIEEKESYKWLQALIDSTKSGVPAACSLLFVSDRECDVIDYFVHERAENVDILVRAAQNRKLVGCDQLLFERLASLPASGEFTVTVGRRGQMPARIATCQLRFAPVTINPPNGNRQGRVKKLAPVTMTALMVSELNPPAGVSSLGWVLLTSVFVASFVQAQQIVRFYALRWLVERFHFVLKSGCSIEKRRLESVEAMQRMLALSNIVAWRLLWLTYLARINPSLPCTVALSDPEWKTLYTVSLQSSLLPLSPPSLHQAVLWIAQLGGFLARAGDGHPGVKVLWRGWSKLQDQVELWLLFHPPILHSTCG